MDDGWGGIHADVFMVILQRIPLSPRRRLRLVCRHWRDVIDERTPVPQAHAKVLAFFGKGSRSRAFGFDDLQGGRSTELNLRGGGADLASVSMIGTCNGLICLKRDRHIAVINPAIREMIAVHPPTTLYRSYEDTYSFGYHPGTGQYKILHVPCSDQATKLDAVHVFTLRDGSREWREVPAPAGSTCLLRFGLANIDGVMYWVTKDAERIMSFDLKDDRVALVQRPPMPVPLPKGLYRPRRHLTDAHGRLGVAVSCPHDEFGRDKTEVWVLGGGREEERTWVKRYTLLAHGVSPRQEIALPHVTHGEHVLTICEPWFWGEREGSS